MDISSVPKPVCPGRSRAFTLVEMLVVIAIMSILMTAGAIGLGGMGGKGVTSGVGSAESLFDEARAVAVGQKTRARVLVGKDLSDTSPANASNRNASNLRRIFIVSAEIDPLTGKEKTGPVWVMSSRPLQLPDQVYFSQKFSKKDQTSGSGTIDTMNLSSGVKASFLGDYFYYEFNAEGICTTPGASFVIGTGARGVNSPGDQPKVTSSGKKDFGGFVVWRNGRTSLFRSPAQISGDINSLSTGSTF